MFYIISCAIYVDVIQILNNCDNLNTSCKRIQFVVRLSFNKQCSKFSKNVVTLNVAKVLICMLLIFF